MNRRIMLLGFSGAAPVLLATASRQVFAQNSGMAAKTVSPTSSTAPLTAAQYKQMTLMGGTLAKQTSQIALQQAQHPKVKEFAGFEVAEQTTIAQVLTDTQNPSPAPLDGAHAAMLKQLQSMSPGPQFDRAYIMGQLQGHQELLAIQNGFLQNSRSMAADNVHVAMLARTSIQMHLALLQDIQSMLAA